ncbi:MAG: DNA polymerase II large subunit, partial [Methanoregula sp.]
MLKLSPEMEQYGSSLMDGLTRAIALAREARLRGLDPSMDVEIPIASDLADRVEALLGIKGVAERIRELESQMSREEAALRIGDDFIARRFGEKNNDEILDHAIRTAMALLTEGVVSAPTEGIAKVGTGKNDDGSLYLKIYYAGPIRSAGGTAQALSVLVGDYVREKLGIGRYRPRPVEVERYIEEIRQYNSIMNLQYLPSEAEIRLIVENCPVCIDGEATEKEEVSGHRNLERVETNSVRGGMALVLAEGIAGKSRKLKSKVEKMNMAGWDWLDKLIAGAAKTGDEEHTPGVKPLDKYLRDLIGGRPVFSYPMRKGGFRLRYGRSRNTGFAAAGFNPATLHLLGGFLAVGTQMKLERPGKACGVVPVDTIEGPTVRLTGGEVIRVDDEKTALTLVNKVERILDVGEILIAYGDFLENNHPLVPAGYCEEWWLLDQAPGTKPPQDEAEALALAGTGGYLYPAYTWFWDDISTDQIRLLADIVSGTGAIEDGALVIPLDAKVKEPLETLLIPHKVSGGMIRIRTFRAVVACLGLDEHLKKRDTWNTAPAGALPLDLVMHLSGLSLRSRSGLRIGGRMGRPGKSKPRKMSPPPHGLFPLGESGGARRSFQEASNHTEESDARATEIDFQQEGGIIEIEVGRRRCPGCGEITFLNRCQKCGTHTTSVNTCPKCGHEVATERCPNCDVPATCSQRIALNVKAEYAQAMERLGIKKESIALVKGVKGVISREKTVEAMEKGILRAQQDIYVFKDGTTRFDMIDLPLTHIRADEVRVPVERMRELGYVKDIDGYDLQNGQQVVELRPQDLLVSDSCADYMIKVARFIDDELTRLYGLPAFYNIQTRDDLVGHLVIGLAPHTSAGVLARIIGFTRANVGYAHPFFHAAKRRNCFYGDTEIEVYDGKTWAHHPIRKFVLENFDVSKPGLDRLGTYYSDPVRPYFTRTVDTTGGVHLRRITSVSIH